MWGGKRGLVVVRVGVGLVGVYVLFGGVIVILDLWEVVVGRGLDGVYVLVGVLRVEGGKMVGEGRVCGKGLVGLGLGIVGGVVGVDMGRDIWFFGWLWGFV